MNRIAICIVVTEITVLSFLLTITSGASINVADGTFNITGHGVDGEGTFTISNGTAEIGLHMVVGQLVDKSKVVIALDKRPPVTSLRTTSSSDHTEMEIGFTKEDEEFLDEMLQEHNKLREIHLSPPLIRNRNMSLQAKALAIQLAAEANLRHSDKASRPDQGENLAMGCTSSGPGITAKDAAKEWYDEVCSHNFFNQAYQDKSGHFSQLVWNATRELGVGKAMGTKFGMNCTFIVARYRPLGNVGNEFATDVSKGNFDSSYCSHVQRDTLPRIDNVWKEYRYRAKIPRIKKIEIL
ncbi:uncharacterized protein LOC141876372 [Acropora palmata]|uniref:uncharacterized protein LOC141876372 n=1 Tax=Acropora palmata TaxID=6131 RepID=UPI003DA00E14